MINFHNRNQILVYKNLEFGSLPLWKQNRLGFYIVPDSSEVVEEKTARCIKKPWKLTG